MSESILPQFQHQPPENDGLLPTPHATLRDQFALAAIIGLASREAMSASAVAEMAWKVADEAMKLRGSGG